MRSLRRERVASFARARLPNIAPLDFPVSQKIIRDKYLRFNRQFLQINLSIIIRTITELSHVGFINLPLETRLSKTDVI